MLPKIRRCEIPKYPRKTEVCFFTIPRFADLLCSQNNGVNFANDPLTKPFGSTPIQSYDFGKLWKVCHKQTARCHANSLDVTSRSSNQHDRQIFITKPRGTYSSNCGIFRRIIKEVASLLTDRFDTVDCVEICDLCSCVLSTSWAVWRVLRTTWQFTYVLLSAAGISADSKCFDRLRYRFSSTLLPHSRIKQRKA